MKQNFYTFPTADLVKFKNKLFINNNIFLHEELFFNSYIGYNKKSKNNHQISISKRVNTKKIYSK